MYPPSNNWSLVKKDQTPHRVLRTPQRSYIHKTPQSINHKWNFQRTPMMSIDDMELAQQYSNMHLETINKPEHNCRKLLNF
jgi:hypothetical protein